MVWDDNRQGTFDIYGSVVTGNGGVGSNTPISSSTSAQSSPEIAFNGTYLVAWTDERRAAGHYDIYGTRVSSDGTTTDRDNGFPIAIEPTSGSVGSPVVSRGKSGDWGVAYHVGDNQTGAAELRLATVSPK